MQSGVPQATIPVQIPISTAGGQTVLQTIPFPVQIPVIPNVVQANGQTLQVVPQLAQVRMDFSDRYYFKYNSVLFPLGVSFRGVAS